MKDDLSPEMTFAIHIFTYCLAHAVYDLPTKIAFYPLPVYCFNLACLAHLLKKFDDYVRQASRDKTNK